MLNERDFQPKEQYATTAKINPLTEVKFNIESLEKEVAYLKSQLAEKDKELLSLYQRIDKFVNGCKDNPY